MNDYVEYLKFYYEWLIKIDNGEIDKAIEEQRKEDINAETRD